MLTAGGPAAPRFSGASPFFAAASSNAPAAERSVLRYGWSHARISDN